MIANAIEGVAKIGATILIKPSATPTKWYKPGEVYTVTGTGAVGKGKPYYYVYGAASSHVVFQEDAAVILSIVEEEPNEETSEAEEEYSGGSVDYYKVRIENPTTAEEPYMAECNDIIEALGMNYAEGNVFKALWRSCAARTLGKRKKGQDAEGLYDAQKIVFFGKRIVAQRGGEL